MDGEISSPPVKQSEPLTNQVLDYIDCCLNNMKQPVSDGKLGLDVVKILSAAEESIKNFVQVLSCKKKIKNGKHC